MLVSHMSAWAHAEDDSKNDQKTIARRKRMAVSLRTDGAAVDFSATYSKR